MLSRFNRILGYDRQMDRHLARTSLHYAKYCKIFGPLGGADFRFVRSQPDTSLHCETTDTG